MALCVAVDEGWGRGDVGDESVTLMCDSGAMHGSSYVYNSPELEFLKSLWGLGTEEE